MHWSSVPDFNPTERRSAAQHKRRRSDARFGARGNGLVVESAENRGTLPTDAPRFRNPEFNTAEAGMTFDRSFPAGSNTRFAKVDPDCAEAGFHKSAGEFLAGNDALDFAEDGGFRERS